jgi:drug/metabolite transporter (DMT)-like permease
MSQIPKPGERVGVVLVLIAATSFAFKGILAKFIYAENISVLQLLFLRFLVGTPIFLAILLCFRVEARKLLSLTRREHAILAVAGFFFFLAAYTDFRALQYIPPGMERLIFFTYPVFTILIHAIVTRSCPTGSQVLAFLVVESGLVLVVGAGSLHTAAPGAVLEGTLWAIAAAITYAAYVVMGQTLTRRMGSVSFTATGNLTAAVLFSALVLLESRPESYFQATPEGWGWILLLTIFGTVIPFLAIFEGIRRIGAVRASLWNMIGPVVTVVAAYFILGDTFNLWQVCGGAIVLSGIWFLERPAGVPPPAE